MSYVKLEDAVKAIEAERLEDDSMYDADLAYNTALKHATYALRSLPTEDGVTDEMIAKRLKSLGYTRLEFQLDSTGGYEAAYYTENGIYRESGPLPAPPTLKSPIDTTN